MLGKIGMSELIVVLIVALIIFGPSKLPALGKMAGKALGTIRHYTDSNNWDELLEEEAEEEEAAKAKKKAAAKKAEAKEEKEPEAEADEPAEEEPAQEKEEENQEQAS